MYTIKQAAFFFRFMRVNAARAHAAHHIIIIIITHGIDFRINVNFFPFVISPCGSWIVDWMNEQTNEREKKIYSKYDHFLSVANHHLRHNLEVVPPTLANTHNMWFPSGLAAFRRDWCNRSGWNRVGNWTNSMLHFVFSFGIWFDWSKGKKEIIVIIIEKKERKTVEWMILLLFAYASASTLIQRRTVCPRSKWICSQISREHYHQPGRHSAHKRRSFHTIL